jgi:RecB family exonuclease
MDVATVELSLPPEGLRQSLLSGFEQCGRRTLAALQTNSDWATGYTEVSADLGTAMHAFAYQYLRTLRRTGEPNMAFSEAAEILAEVYVKLDFVLPTAEREELHWLARGFCHFKWNAKRILAAEKRLMIEVYGEDGIGRTITGQPDLIEADPPEGIEIVDYKSGRGRPPSPRGQKDAEYAEGKQYLSARGHFQLDTYGAMALEHYKMAEYVKLKELHLRSGQVREAKLYRSELPRVLRELGHHAQMLDRAVKEGPTSKLFDPRAGGHCARQCPVSTSCPIPREQRGIGAIDSDERMDEAAAAFVVSHAQAELLRKQMKERFEATGRPGKLADGREVRYYQNGSGGRSFGVCDADAPLDPKTIEAIAMNTGQHYQDLEAALQASLEAAAKHQGPTT